MTRRFALLALAGLLGLSHTACYEATGDPDAAVTPTEASVPKTEASTPGPEAGPDLDTRVQTDGPDPDGGPGGVTLVTGGFGLQGPTGAASGVQLLEGGFGLLPVTCDTSAKICASGRFTSGGK